ncbi:MAG: aspartate aminotransferase family protein [Saprospiraceae bacterium]|nr:aspartate aminotransferase family protein [Saprospiraceae bacterium]
MTHSEFRQRAHQLADWMADYFENIAQYPVKPAIAPGDIKAQLPDNPPLASEPFDALMADFQSIILPGMTHWSHPQFFAYFPTGNSAPSVLAEMLTAAMGAQCMIWQTSPAAEELEERVMEWLRDMLGLPNNWVGVIQDTASTATLASLITAREQASQWAINQSGFYQSPRLRVYASAQVHSSILKDVRIAGYGEDNLVYIPTDDAYAMIPEALEQAMLDDIEQGFRPACVVAAIGTTSSTAMDPLRPIGEICRRHKVFLHVDAAYAGAAFLLPEMRHLIEGIELADSLVFNPHKWMFTNFDCTAYFVRDKAALVNSFSILPEYLKTPEDQLVNNYRDWGIPLGRRFRALKLWFVIRSYGVEGLQSKIRSHIEYGQRLAALIAAAPDFEIMAPVPLNLVCFRYLPQPDLSPEAVDRLNEQLLLRLNGSGRILLTQTRLSGIYVIRMVAGQADATWEEIEKGWELIQYTARSMQL